MWSHATRCQTRCYAKVGIPTKFVPPASRAFAGPGVQIKSSALHWRSAFSSPQPTSTPSTSLQMLHKSTIKSILVDWQILHLGQLLVLDPECTHHSFFLGENHGLRFGRANSHPTHFIFSCKRPQCKSLPDETRRTTSSAKDPESTTPGMLHLPPHDWA